MILKVTMDLNLHKHLKKPIKYYSGGNKRKLSAAIALIGNPVIVYLGKKLILLIFILNLPLLYLVVTLVFFNF